jgi:Glycosyl transferases group 1
MPCEAKRHKLMFKRQAIETWRRLTRNKAMKLAFVGQKEYFRFHFESDFDDLYGVRKFQWRSDAAVDYYEDVIAFRPDLTVIFRAELVPTELFLRLSGIKIAISSEPMPKIIEGNLMTTADSLGRFELFKTIFERRLDYIFHYDQSSESFFQSQGVQLSGFVPLPIATRTLKPNPTVASRDILFFGRSTPHREEFLGLLKRDYDVLHIAHGFPGPNGVIEKDFLPVISSFRVALNIHAENELSWEPRMQQMMACGILVVSEPISPNSYLVAGRDYLCVTSPAELYETCREVLSNPKKFAHIRDSGLEQVRTRLDARAVFTKLFSNIAAGVYKPARFAPELTLGGDARTGV